MGSTGSGNFTDFPPNQNTNQSFDNKGRGQTNEEGGSSGEDKCKKAFSTKLEEVDNCSYYQHYKHLPNEGLGGNITFNGNRIVAMIDDYELGFLPTSFNYLMQCLQEVTYLFEVTKVQVTPINSIIISVIPQ